MAAPSDNEEGAGDEIRGAGRGQSTETCHHGEAVGVLH